MRSISTELLATAIGASPGASTEDVKAIRPDLDDDQAWEILGEFAAACKDCPAPMLETMRQLADMSYPNSKQLFRERLARLVSEIDALPDRERDNPAAYGEAAAVEQ